MPLFVFMELKEFFEQNREVAVAFSGGVDSSYLLFVAGKYAERCCGYYVKSAFQPEFEYNDALKLAKDIGVNIKVINADVLENEIVVSNPSDRCYYCKRVIFEKICSEARADKFNIILDGTNASDDAGDRPGMKALRELSVKSPLRECGLTKDEIRSLSREAGLFTWDKPAYACLATRIPSGERITLERLIKIEKAEDFLFSLGYTDFRVRNPQNTAKLQFRKDQLKKAENDFVKIKGELSALFDNVIIDRDVTR